MIKTIIDNPVKLDLVREVFKKYIKYTSISLRTEHDAFSVAYGINVWNDRRSLRVTISVNEFTYYSIISDDFSQITCEYGLMIHNKEKSTIKYRQPKDLQEYLICTEITYHCIKAIYNVLSLGEIKRDD